MNTKKIKSILMGGMLFLSIMLAFAPAVQADSAFHRIKGTLSITDQEDTYVAPPGIEITLEIPEKDFTETIETIEETSEGYNFITGGFKDDKFGDQTVIFTVTDYATDGIVYVILNKTETPVSEYILDFTVVPDEDNDGVPDTEDICPGHDDTIDTDEDGIPDGCDDTPNGEGSSGGGDNTGGGGGPSLPPTSPTDDETDNQAPIADAAGPYGGNMGEPILFNGSRSYDPDGDALTYHWNFGDGNTSNDMSPTHSFESEKTFTINLTVSDGSLSDIDQTTATITISNNPPQDLMITGPSSGHVGSDLYFEVSATDPEGNTIKYSLQWGDDTDETNSDPLTSGESFEASHTYESYGEYTITALATDELFSTVTTEKTIFIDVHPIQDKITGMLVDVDSDDTFDVYENDTSKQTALKQKDQSTYYIDEDDDGDYDYTFDVDTDELTEIADNPEFSNIALVALALIVGAIMLIVLFFIKKRRDSENKS